MGFDLRALQVAVKAHDRVVRVVVASVQGSAPREVGAAMLVWDDGQSGTIGGGTLEFEAVVAARLGRLGLSRHALGPDLGQCCGGAVQLLSEVYDSQALAGLEGDGVARPVVAGTDMPMSVKRLMAQARGQGVRPPARLIEGWMVEPVARPERQVWVWGAGHVGRALVDVLAPLPELAITWVDTGFDRFPDGVAEDVTVLPAADPAGLVTHAPTGAEHLIVTYSHTLDLELCHQLLSHGFGFAGLIGSATKWARFRSRLMALGHGAEQIARITCPIGDPSLGKHPQAIALGVGAALLQGASAAENRKDRRA